MAVKSVSIRIEQEMLDKIGYIADYEGRSVNSHILVLIRNEIGAFEKEHGEITGDINPAENVKPTRFYPSKCYRHYCISCPIR